MPALRSSVLPAIGTPRNCTKQLSQPLEISRSCIECRRLKRKCDRRFPCDICKRLNKTCSYPEQAPAHRVLEELTAEVEDLRRQLAEYSSGSLSFTAGSSLSSSVPPRRNLPSNSESEASKAFFAWPAESSGPISSSDLMERQPIRALGYEWSEAQAQLPRLYDGTASLTENPDGSGYLGFASGATLLRVLHSCAGHVSQLPLPMINVLPSETPNRSGYNLTNEDAIHYVNTYFQTFHQQYPFLHEATFRAQWSELIPRPPIIQWQLLVNVVMAMGAFCSPNSSLALEYLLDRAMEGSSSFCHDTGSLVLVQAFSLLANLLQKTGKPNTGFMYLGTATRMAVSLGIHRELPFWHITPFEKEIRRRVWWWLFLADSGASMTFGRPFFLPVTGADVECINNIDDLTFTPTALSLPTQSQNRTLYTNIIRLISLQQTINPIYSRVISTPPPGSDEVLVMDIHLQDWESALPPSIQWNKDHRTFSTCMLHWRIWSTRIIMHRRAFLDRALKGVLVGQNAHEGSQESPTLSSDHRSSIKCLEAAGQTVDSIRVFHSNNTQNPSDIWYSLHYLFQAIFVILIALYSDQTSPQMSGWRRDVEVTRDILESMLHNEAAQKCLSIIDGLVPRSPPAQLDEALLAEIIHNNPDWLFDFSLNDTPVDSSVEMFADLPSLPSI